MMHFGNGDAENGRRNKAYYLGDIKPVYDDDDALPNLLICCDERDAATAADVVVAVVCGGSCSSCGC